jgi:putative ABC transport system ATP-binding protein
MLRQAPPSAPASPSPPVIAIEGLNHHYESGLARRQILFDVNVDIHVGELVILSGPSGSGKTTLLSLAGGLRSVQEGSLRILGEEMRGASRAALVRVRKRIGYIFQAHNLLGSFTARQNVEMSLRLHHPLPRSEIHGRAEEMLRAVGLETRADHYPAQLSGGQKQRVAIARALAGRPRIVLADEPTASLDKQSGRDVADLLHDLAKRDGIAVVLVTHDNRILDIADRIISLEDGRLSSFNDAVISTTRHMLHSLALNNQRNDLERQIRDLPLPKFLEFFDRITREAEQFVRTLNLSESDAFESMLDQMIDACTLKVGQLLNADRATFFLVDREHGELWTKVAEHDGDRPLEIRMPIGVGIAGHVARTRTLLNVPDAHSEPLFNREVDAGSGYRTRSVLCAPILDEAGEASAVVQLLNKSGDLPFDDTDERRLGEFASGIGLLLDSWRRMQVRRSRTSTEYAAAQAATRA